MGAGTEQDTKAQADEERAAKEAAKQAEREAKAAEREAAKAKAAEEKAAAKAAREREAVVKILQDGEIDPSTVADDISRADARELVKAKRAEERANRPKKASLTLSQRRALLRLGEGEVVPKTAFNSLPLDHLVSVGLAETFETQREDVVTETVDKTVKIPKSEQTEGGPTEKVVKDKVEKTVKVDATGYRLTDAGKERVGEINPKWLTWKPEGQETPAAS